MKKALLLFTAVVMIFLSPRGWAAKDSASDSSASVGMGMGLTILSRVYLRIGSPGSFVDTVTFNVTGIPEHLPLVQGDVDPAFTVWTNSNSGVVLTADSSQTLTGDAGRIPLSYIKFSGTGVFSGIEGFFNNTSNQRIAHLRRGTSSGRFSFYYRNTYKVRPGSYNGMVTYTVSVP